MTLARRLVRDLHAARHYRPGQVWHRAVTRLRRQFHTLAPGIGRRRLARFHNNPPAIRDPQCSELLCEFARHAEVAPLHRLDDLLAGRFTFLGETRELGVRPDWAFVESDRPPHLWRMNLHYHRFVVDAAVAGLRSSSGPALAGMRRASELLDGWSRACRYGERWTWQDAWHPYSASTRLLNGWLARRLLERFDCSEASALARRLDLRASEDATLIEHWLEWDLCGNHLLRNAAALLAAGRWFAGDLGAAWRRRAEHVLHQELRRQILADGFHEERSPMYHAQLVEDLLLAGDEPPGGGSCAREWIPRLLDSLTATLHPDGQISLFNDSAYGIAAPPQQLIQLAADRRETPAAPQDLAVSGYFSFREAGDALIFDAGPLGPDHLPAHAHCDALSFEYSAKSERVIVDTGVDRYEAGPERQFQRSTAAHSTLQVEDREQGQVFSSFRMGRRPRVHGHRIDPFTVEGDHDGFGSTCVHRRRVEWRGAAGFCWTDELIGCVPVPVTIRLGLAPSCRVEIGARTARVANNSQRFELVAPAGGELHVDQGSYCERFGACVSRPVICWRGLVGSDQPLRFEFRSTG